MIQTGWVYAGETPTALAVVEPVVEPEQRLLLLEVFEASLAEKKKLSRGGWDVHRSTMKILAKWCKKRKLSPLQELTPQQGQKFLNYLVTYVSFVTKQPVFAKTFNSYGLNLKPFGNWPVEQDWIKRKHRPFQTMKKRKVGKGEKHTPYSQVQLTAILDVARADPQFYLFLHFL